VRSEDGRWHATMQKNDSHEPIYEQLLRTILPPPDFVGLSIWVLSIYPSLLSLSNREDYEELLFTIIMTVGTILIVYHKYVLLCKGERSVSRTAYFLQNKYHEQKPISNSTSHKKNETFTVARPHYNTQAKH